MKKLLLTLLATIFIVISSFSQTYIGNSKDFIMSAVNKEFVESYAFENHALSLTFIDGNSAVYVFDEYDICDYYIMVYNINYLSQACGIVNNAGATKIGDFRWYLLDEDKYIYIKINSSSNSRVIFMSFFPLEYEDDIDIILSIF